MKRVHVGIGLTFAATLLAGCSSASPPANGSRNAAATTRCVERWSRSAIPGMSSSTASALPTLGIAGHLDGPLAAMAAVSPTDVWAVGARGDNGSNSQGTTLTEHWDGTRWAVVPAPDAALSTAHGEPGDELTGVTATSSHDVWAVGTSGVSQALDNGSVVVVDQTLAEHWNGQRWSIVPTANSSPDDDLVAVSAHSPSDVWAVGAANHTVNPFLSFVTPLAEHWDGTSWSAVHVPTPGLDPSNPAAINAVVAAGNAGQSKPYADASFSAVHAIAADDVWAVGVLNHYTDGSAPGQTFTEHWDGTRWSVVNAPDVHVAQLQHDADDSLNAVTATRGDDVWAVGTASPQGTLTLHWDGTSWTLIPSARSGFYSYLSDVAAISASDVWAVGSAIEHWGGHRWTQTTTIDGRIVQPLVAVTAVSAHDVWMVSAKEFLHYTCT